eukprot:51521-Rhodomonas_salina.1
MSRRGEGVGAGIAAGYYLRPTDDELSAMGFLHALPSRPPALPPPNPSAPSTQHTAPPRARRAGSGGHDSH